MNKKQLIRMSVVIIFIAILVAFVLNLLFKIHGIAMKANCIFRMPGDFSEEDILIEQPTVFQENKKIELPTKFIHGITFVPERTIVLPGMLHFENVPKGEFVEI